VVNVPAGGDYQINGVSIAPTFQPDYNAVQYFDKDSGKVTWAPAASYDHFTAIYTVTGNDTIGGSSAGNPVDIVSQYMWVPCRTSTNTWSNYSDVNFTYDNDTIVYDSTSTRLNFDVNITGGGTTNTWSLDGEMSQTELHCQAKQCFQPILLTQLNFLVTMKMLIKTIDTFYKFVV